MQLTSVELDILTHEIAVAWKQRLPTEVEDVAPWIPRVSSKDSRIRHVRDSTNPGSTTSRRRPSSPAPPSDRPEPRLIKSPILRPARCVHQHGLQAEFVLRCRGGGEGGYRSALGLGGVMERRIDVRDVSVGARESRRGYPRAIHPRDRRAERSPPRGFSSVGYVEIWAEGHSRSAGCGPSSTTCASSWADPSSSSCAHGGKGKDVRACA